MSNCSSNKKTPSHPDDLESYLSNDTSESLSNEENLEEEEYPSARELYNTELTKLPCSCNQNYIKIKKKSSKRVYVSKRSFWDPNELTTRRQKIEIALSQSEIDEAINTDHHNFLQKRYERVEHIMESVTQYLDCLQLETKASYRLCQQLNGLIVNEKSFVITEPLSQLVKKLCECPDFYDEIYPIQQRIAQASSASKDLQSLVKEYNKRKDDFNTATQNFKLILQSSGVNMRALDKLQRQFDGILLNYQHSRCMLDQELPLIISLRMQILCKCFNELGCDLQKIASDRADLSSLLKHLEKSLSSYNDLEAIGGNLQSETM